MVKPYLLLVMAIPLLHSPLNAFIDPLCSSDLGGFYFGLNGGFSSYRWGGNELDAYFDPQEKASYRIHDTNLEFGIQMGYDWICGHRLFGLVADWNWTHVTPHIRNDEPGIPPFILPTHTEIERELRWFSSIRARGGLLWGNLLLYITGGGAMIDHKTRIAFSGPLQDSPFFINEHHSLNDHQWGWVAGLGTELALGCSWTVNVEILYLNFDSKKITFNSPTFSQDFSFDFYDQIWAGRVGFNYHFSPCSLW